MIHFFIPVIPEWDDHRFFTGKDPEEKKCMADDTPGLYQPEAGISGQVIGTGVHHREKQENRTGSGGVIRDDYVELSAIRSRTSLM